jgi:hypothetical protein
MKAKEFIVESSEVSNSLPGVYIQPQLRNQDPYLQYRYGMAVAAARAYKNGDLNGSTFKKETNWSENLIQIMFAKEDEETIQLASELFGVSPVKISNSKSEEEEKSINKASPVAKPKRNKFGI